MQTAGKITFLFGIRFSRGGSRIAAGTGIAPCSTRTGVKIC